MKGKGKTIFFPILRQRLKPSFKPGRGGISPFPSLFLLPFAFESLIPTRSKPLAFPVIPIYEALLERRKKKASRTNSREMSRIKYQPVSRSLKTNRAAPISNYFPSFVPRSRHHPAFPPTECGEEEEDGPVAGKSGTEEKENKESEELAG